MARNIVKYGETLLSKMEKKISALESDNKKLREELSQIQMSLASLISEVSEK